MMSKKEQEALDLQLRADVVLRSLDHIKCVPGSYEADIARQVRIIAGFIKEACTENCGDLRLMTHLMGRLETQQITSLRNQK